MASKLYVGNLSYTTTSDSLREHFAQCGTVESARVVTDRMSGDSRGFGFVEMSTEAEATAAINSLNGQPFEGRNLKVDHASPQGSGAGAPRSGGRSGGFGGGYGGGRSGGGFGGGRSRTSRW